MAGGWMSMVAAMAANALGLPLLLPLEPDVPAEQVDATLEEDADEDETTWRFDPARCGTTQTVETASPRKWIRYKVASRETVEEVAFRHGVAPWELRGWNGMADDAHKLKRGRRLRIKASRLPPRPEKAIVTVAEGDTWSSLAQANGVSPSDLRAYNWPYRGKMTPGSELTVYVDPILRDWIAAAPADGERVRRGAVGVGSPDEGTLLNGVQIPKGDGYWLRLPRSAYGTTHAVTQLLEAIDGFREETPWTGTLAIGSMSGPRGGPLGHHKSHQTGRDVDIRLPRREGVSRYAELRPRRVDWTATWVFVQALARVDTQVIFFDYKRQKYLYRAAKAAGASDEELAALVQYPRGSYARRGLVRHYPGHEKHLHIRFGCGPCEVSCAGAVPDAPGPNEPASEAGD
ncbi:MAG: penicillin-insensitive murein endopeptidase [Myxococcota bacterium]